MKVILKVSYEVHYQPKSHLMAYMEDMQVKLCMFPQPNRGGE